ncbi:hypothetical protein AV530_013773 [Patagioenas fasciata monilis]|uniref:Uncharacterized protein n=1 Tax=Patagioenas fasciata monilis TaxID=372326 RepID=A0A1V4J7Q1_PATFA|nr:hypothetical protein AV530_013773 [Patagioenas fasciata monilis]
MSFSVRKCVNSKKRVRKTTNICALALALAKSELYCAKLEKPNAEQRTGNNICGGHGGSAHLPLLPAGPSGRGRRLPEPEDRGARVCCGPVHRRNSPYTQQEVPVQFQPEAQSSRG